jgi:peptidoglycan hydrolase-like protein with peptidoglycan-binding domain
MRQKLSKSLIFALLCCYSVSGYAQQQVSPDETRLLQGLLGILGYYNGPIDGVFGAATLQAVTRYSHAKGLASRWLFDKATRQQLSRLLVADFVAYLTALNAAGAFRQPQPPQAIPPTERDRY